MAQHERKRGTGEVGLLQAVRTIIRQAGMAQSLKTLRALRR